MHFLIVKNAYWTKWTPQPQQTLSPTRTPTPSSAQPHTTTLEIIQAYFIQINPPPGAQIKKQIYTCILKFHFRWGLFYTKLQNSPKIPPSNPILSIPQLRIWTPSQKSTHTLLFASSNPFQNGLTQPNKTAMLSHFRQNTRQGYYPPKSYQHQPSNPWKFHSNWPYHWKVNQQFD